MDTYSLMREFADSWALLALTGFFVAMLLWVFRPGSSKTHKDTANIPFRNEDKPACASSGDCGSGAKGATFKEAWK